jgi:hypothetical protein
VTGLTLGKVLGAVGLLCALVGLFVLEGISIEFVGIIVGALGYYFGLREGDRVAQILGIAAVVSCVVSMLVSGLTAQPQ